MLKCDPWAGNSRTALKMNSVGGKRVSSFPLVKFLVRCSVVTGLDRLLAPGCSGEKGRSPGVPFHIPARISPGWGWQPCPKGGFLS